jgi:hypothetical protein
MTSRASVLPGEFEEAEASRRRYRAQMREPRPRAVPRRKWWRAALRWSRRRGHAGRRMARFS